MLLKGDWRVSLAELIEGAREEILIASPYISRAGSEFVASHLSGALRSSGSLFLLTDLSPLPICQGATEPAAVAHLADLVGAATVAHLPKLHAKVYIADSARAIVTSGNLTRGGLWTNFEYGVKIDEPSTATRVRGDVMEYAGLGAVVVRESLQSYCAIAETVRSSYREQAGQVAEATRQAFEAAVRRAEDELIRIRLGGAPVHAVFARTILYLLRRHGPLSTQEMHPLIEAIHPDLCDPAIDRVIDGRRFGKKWKHAVRSSQQILKARGLIDLVDSRWCMLAGAHPSETKGRGAD